MGLCSSVPEPSVPEPPHLLKTPSTPVMPIPSTMSLDSLKGTVSGVGSVFPCSKATPGSTREREGVCLQRHHQV